MSCVILKPLGAQAARGLGGGEDWSSTAAAPVVCAVPLRDGADVCP